MTATERIQAAIEQTAPRQVNEVSFQENQGAEQGPSARCGWFHRCWK